MNKHVKELLYISLWSLPIILMFVSSAVTEIDTEIPYEIFDRKIMLISNSLALVLLALPYTYIAIWKSNKLKDWKLKNGTVITALTFSNGNEVFIKTDDELVVMPIGEYELESGEILVVKEDGLIEELKEAKVIVEDAKGPTSQENDYNMNFKKVSLSSIVFVFILTFLFVLVDSPIVIWNKSVVFPEFLSSFETWAKLKESQLEELTIYLVSFDNFNEYLIGIIAIAIIPGFFEEFLFRGIIQKNFYLISRNHHLAIWLSAFIFSAIHMQFYGFFPRLLMGVLFGYLFHWSGSITYAMIAHAFNNFFAVTMWYAAQQGYFGKEYELGVNEPPDLPVVVIILSLILFLITIYFVRQKLLNERADKMG